MPKFRKTTLAAGYCLAILIQSVRVCAAQTGLVAAPPNLAPPQPFVPAETLKLAENLSDRMTVEVHINGQGPFRFIVDTGADHSVISSELAAKLALPAGVKVEVNGSGGAKEVDSAKADRLDLGQRTFRDLNLPQLTESDLGAAGMLGLDVLGDQAVVLDFEHHRLYAKDSRRYDAEAGAIVVRGKYRMGQLILVDAVIGKTFVYVILDTGAQNSIGNSKLKDLLRARRRDPTPVHSVNIISVTGQTTPAEIDSVPLMTIGAVTIRNMPLAFAELHTFDVFGLSDRPALLLGMDVLKLFKRVKIDFPRHEAAFVTQ